MEMIELQVPTSKSLTQRALVLAALAPGESRILSPLDCDDSNVLVAALEALGCPVHRHGDDIVLSGGGPLRAPKERIHLGNAGTAVRFLSALSLVVEGPIRIDGDPAMRRRPMPGLLAALRALGARVEEEGLPSCPPVTIHPPDDPDHLPEAVMLDVTGSSQQLSALMLVASRLPRGLRITLSGTLPSRSYVDLTERILEDFGVSVAVTRAPDGARVVTVTGGGLSARTYSVEGDHSSASYPLASGFLTGLPVRVTNTRSDSLQGDRIFGTLLERLAMTPRSGTTRVFDCFHVPDIAPTLATCCLFAQGPTSLTGCAHLRLKESDRLVVLARGFRAVGADLDELNDGLLIRPRPLEGGATLDPAQDHRMTMCFALLGLRLPGLRILDRHSVSKSYPGFFEMLSQFGPLP